MKYSELRKKFSNKLNFVKPLYNRVRFRNRVQPKSIIINIERKLHGRGFYVNREFSGNENVHANRIYLNSSRNKCVSRKFSGNGVRDFKRNYDVWNNQTMLSIKEDKENRMYKGNKFNEGGRDAQDKPVVCHKALMTWLQVYPAPSLPNEGVVSIVFRCVMCQLGLAAFLVSWTVIWLLMISYFEEPHELKIAHDFTKEQNQLVINLATELRQITPISPKWREMIETRIEDERKLTVQAVGKGAKLHPGQYWDLSGTFLFTVFVMTALGFGAPVPQTAWGRTCTVVYAAFAVPGHIFFMVNISTCITFHVERIIKTRRFKRTNDIKQDVQSSSRNSDEHEFDSLTNFGLRRNISKILRMFVVARGLPLTILTYYMIGAISFGYLRGLPAFETIMFPLEFTTSGGLEMVRSHVRILYAFYVEGAVFILACTIATLKFHSRNSIEDMIEKHRLFSMEPCDECKERNIKYPPSHQVK